MAATISEEKSVTVTLSATVQKIVTDYEKKRKRYPDAGRIYTDMCENEKRQLQMLNDLLAAYLERLSHLQLRNQDMTDLKAHWESDLDIIRKMYANDISDTRKYLDNSKDITQKLKGEFERLQKEMTSCVQRVEKIVEARSGNKIRIGNLLNQLAEIEKQLKLVNERVKNLQDEGERLKGENSILEDQIRQAYQELAEERNKVETHSQRLDAMERKIKLIRDEQEAKYRRLVRPNNPSGPDPVAGCREIERAVLEIRGRYQEWALQNKIDVDELLRTVRIDDSYVIEIARCRQESSELRETLKTLEKDLFDFENNNSVMNKNLLDLHFELKKERREYEESLSMLMPRIQVYVNENISFQEKIKVTLDTNKSLKSELDHYDTLIKMGTVNLNDLERRMAVTDSGPRNYGYVRRYSERHEVDDAAFC